MANLICKYNVTDISSPTKICNSTSSVSDILYNGVSIDITYRYQFNTLGEHTLEFVLQGDTIGGNAFGGCTSLTSVSLGSGLTSIGDYAFNGCRALTGELVIPDSVISIGNGAFSSCKSLTNIVIPDSVTYIGNSAFKECTSLTGELVIPDSITSIGERTFEDCYSLTGRLTIPDSVTSIGENAFSGCTSLTSLTLGSGLTEIGDYAFSICSGLTGELVIPDSVTSIGRSAFEYCYGLTSLTLNSSLTEIGSNAFKYCRGLTGELVIPNSVITINYGVFQSCSRLTSVVIPDSVTSIGEDAFYGCPNLTGELVIPDSVISIGTDTFYGCSGLTSLSLGSGLTTIGISAFRFCYGLSVITSYATEAPTVDADSTFYNVATGGTLYYPEGSDYSTWLSKKSYYLGYYDWNGVEFEVDNPPTPDNPDEPDIPPTPEFPEGEIVTPNQTKTIPSSGDTFRYKIEANNMQGLGRYYPSDIDWITLTYIDDYNFNIIVDENEGDERSETIHFVYYDNNGDAFEHKLTISQDGKAVEPDEPDVPPTPPTPDEPEEPVEKTPSIVVSKNNINLDNVGDTSIIQVTYINVDEIVPPEVPDGFTIEEIERVVSEEGIQVKYKITRVSPKRQNAQINFKGNTSGGKTATSKDVTLKGEPCPAEVRLWSLEEKDGVLVFEASGTTSTVDVIVNGANTPYEFSYEIDGNGIACTYNELDSDSGDGSVNWKYKFTSIPNNGNNPYTGTITFRYKDELTDKTLSYPFYVRYANEGRIEAAAEKYAYDKDGNNLISTNGNRFSMSYFNMETINEPECDVDWLIVGEGVKDTGVYVDERVKYNHSITIQPNEGNSRRCTVTFSGKGVDGKNYTFDIEVTQEGDDTVKPIDEGFIELQQLSVVLNADGDAQTFQVKYYDAKTIYEPELAGTWATITEVSRTEPVPDVAWNGEDCESVIVTYQVTAQPTESGRQMKVKFKADINYYDGSVVYMEKDKFIIYQLAEGSTEVQGSVLILRYSNTFTYYGSPTGWNFRVAYDNVTPDTPTISESWCRVAEVKDLKADEYDYYKEYILEMDANNSNLSRTCTITFIGHAEDGTQIKTPFQFTQQGQEEIVNEGEYDNYKGYFMDFEGAVHSVSFITNPRSDAYGDIRLAGDSPVVVSYSENGYLYDPIRTSTCTVKVVSSHYLMNLYTGKAQGTQVILRNEDRGTIEWCGFLQPNLYNQGFTECIEEIEFEASDCLSALQYLKYEYYYNGNGQPMIVSFKNIVDTIADRCKLINSYVFTQKLYSNSDESKIFDFKDFYISENNFYSEESEPWTYQEVLEETCKYFGYVCFQWGDRIYFMDYDKYNSDKSMVGYRYVKEDGWDNRNYITLSNSNRITEKSIRGTGADISLDDVFNKVSVNCNYYNLEHLLPDLFEDDLLTERNQMTLTTVVNREQEIGSRSDYIVYDHKNIKSHFYKPIVGEYSHEIEVQPTEDEFNSRTFFKDFVGANIVDMYYLNYSDLNGKTFESKEWEKYLMISQLNRPWCKGPIVGEYDTTKYWENYNFPIMEFTQIPQIFIDNHKEVYESNTTTGGRVPTSSTTPNSRPSINTNKSEHYLVIRAEGAFTPFFGESYVPENVEQKGFKKWSNTEYGGYTFDLIKDTTNKTQNFTPKLTFYLEIPTAGWWDGSKWVDYETWFEVPLEELHYSDEIWYSWKNTQNKVETNLFLGISGYKIKLPESMESTAFMQFKIGMPKRFAHVSGGDDNGEAGNAYCFIKNLEMNIVSRNTALLKDEDVVFENVIDDNNVVDGPEWELKITSDNNITYSFSTVSTKYGEDMVNTTNFRFYDLEGELVLPEEAIIEKFVKQYSTPTLKENMTVDMTFTPAQMVKDEYWGDSKNFVITSQEIDYARCSQRITLLEKK